MSLRCCNFSETMKTMAEHFLFAVFVPANQREVYDIRRYFVHCFLSRVPSAMPSVHFPLLALHSDIPENCEDPGEN